MFAELSWFLHKIEIPAKGELEVKAAVLLHAKKKES